MAAKRPAPEPLEATTQSPTTKRPKNDDQATIQNSTLESQTLENNPVHAENKQPANAKPETEPDADIEDAEDEDMDQRQNGPLEGYGDIYLDTINRQRLDFDFEKVCSVTLNNVNIYACLVCGSYFQGRGKKTPAYYHSLEADHHPFIHMTTKAVYILPEGYEVHSTTLNDIKAIVEPQYTKEQVEALDNRKEQHRDLMGNEFTPGFIGMNNIGANDYLNAVIQALSHVTPLRDFFLLADDSVFTHQLAKRFAVLVRKIWNARAFKAHVSPHEFMQVVHHLAPSSFGLNVQGDPALFLTWLLNMLHTSIGGGAATKANPSFIHKMFQGSLKIESQAISARADGDDRLRFEDKEIKSQTSKFSILPLDPPSKPLYTDDRSDTGVIPQVALTDILSKYNGILPQEKRDRRLRYRLQHPLPPYIIMHVKRFEDNKWLGEVRNPTIITFEPRGLDMSPYVEPNPKLHPVGEPIIYDLVANVNMEAVKTRHDSAEGEQEKKIWRAQVKEQGVMRDEKLGDVDRQQWWEMQDLFVNQTSADRLNNREAYIMIWERRK